MKAFAIDRFALPLPPGHRFPIAKYARLRERLEHELDGVHVCEADAASNDDLALAHDGDYVQRAIHGLLDAQQVRAIGLPWSL